MASIANDALHADIICVFPNKKRLYGHSVVLSKYAYFNALISRLYQESQSSTESSLDSQKKTYTINFCNDDSIDYEVMLVMWRWMYTGDRDLVNDENALQLYMHVQQFGVLDLRDYLVHYMTKRVNMDNFKFFQSFANQNDGLERLKCECTAYM